MGDGMYFTMYPNHILEAINQSDMTKTQIKICSHIIRQTYGWHRKWAVITHEEFAYACATSRQSISRQLQPLINGNVAFTLNKKPFQASAYKMNENIYTWDPSIIQRKYLNQTEEDLHYTAPDSHGVVVYRPLAKSTHDNPGLHGGLYYKPTPRVNSALHVHANPALHDEDSSGLGEPRSQQPLNKHLNKSQRQCLNIYSEEEEEYKLAKLLYECIVDNFPGYEEPDIQKWSDIMHKMMLYDERDPESIKQAIYFVRQDVYWGEQILRPEEFRGRFDYIEAQRLHKY